MSVEVGSFHAVLCHCHSWTLLEGILTVKAVTGGTLQITLLQHYLPAGPLWGCMACMQEPLVKIWTWPEVGDAPVWGTALMVHLLQQRPAFELGDLSRRLLLEADLAGPSGAPCLELPVLRNYRPLRGCINSALCITSNGSA
jgi:hypothetical protein